MNDEGLTLDAGRCVLIVQDLQNDVMIEGGAFADSGAPQHAKEQNVVENVKGLAATCRSKGIPVILGDVCSILEWQEWLATAPWPSVEAVLEDAAAIDVAAWLGLREAEELALDAVIPDEQAALAAWPRDQEPLGCLGETRRHAPDQPLWIGKLATSDSWAVAACLQIGGWNDCPATPVHVALWHSWEERFGARIACATGSTVEFTVDRPPRVREQALRLAREHFLYCPDQIDQGYGTFERLAAALLDAPVWRFWWD